MFTDDEKKYMRLLGLTIDFDNMTDADYIEIEEVVGDRLVTGCLDEDYYPTEEGWICEGIITKVTSV